MLCSVGRCLLLLLELSLFQLIQGLYSHNIYSSVDSFIEGANITVSLYWVCLCLCDVECAGGQLTSLVSTGVRFLLDVLHALVEQILLIMLAPITTGVLGQMGRRHSKTLCL